MSKPVAIQLFPMSDYLEDALAKRLAVVRWFELSASDQHAWLTENADGVQAVVTAGHIGCDNALIDQLPNLGIIATNGVGYDRVDLPYTRARNIAVTITPNALSEDVADLAVGLIISLLRQIPQADAFVRRGEWVQGNMPLASKVSGRRFGIIGLGNIGMEIAKRLEAFGPVAYTGSSVKNCAYTFHPDVIALAKAVDVLIVACAANAATRHLVNAAVMSALGSTGYLVNVSRGSVVDEVALMAALDNGVIAGAALDVFEDEPNVPDALKASDRVLLAPHIASATHETRKRMADIVLENLDAFLSGKAPPHALG